MEAPPWTLGLGKCGLYYEGVVDDLEKTLELHHKMTVTTFGTRTSSSCQAKSCSQPESSTNASNKENDCQAKQVTQMVR